jgi:hypothetical protein
MNNSGKITNNILVLMLSEKEAEHYSVDLQERVIEYVQKEKGEGWDVFASCVELTFVKRPKQVIQYQQFSVWLEKYKKKKKK